jgi:hypothetical protein
MLSFDCFFSTNCRMLCDAPLCVCSRCSSVCIPPDANPCVCLPLCVCSEVQLGKTSTRGDFTLKEVHPTTTLPHHYTYKPSPFSHMSFFQPWSQPS